MNDVFPQVRTVLLTEAPVGSILRIPRSQTLVYALVTDQIVDGVRTVVMLNAEIPNYPKVIFAQKWRLDERYLCYDKNVRFLLSMEEECVDDYGHDWWQTPGVIVSVGNQLLIRAAPMREFGYENTLVDIQTGSVFDGAPPNGMFSFGAWQLLIEDGATKRSFELCRQKIPKRQR